MTLDLTTITPADFKAQFFRDFAYLNEYSNTAVYSFGTIVQYTDGYFYRCLSNGTVGIPCTNVQYWEIVPREMANDFVQDQDIENAFSEATILFNPALWDGDANEELAYLYLTAHFMVTDLRRANAGLTSRPEFVASARTVGSVSETYELPDMYKNNPILNGYLKTGYGMKYLDLMLPNLVGNTVAICGTVGWT